MLYKLYNCIAIIDSANSDGNADVDAEYVQHPQKAVVAATAAGSNAKMCHT